MNSSVFFTQSNTQSEPGKISQLSQRDEILKPLLRSPANDDVIEDFDFQKLSCPDQIACHFDVSFRGCRITAGMVMGQHQGRGIGRDGEFKDFAWMHENRIESAL